MTRWHAYALTGVLVAAVVLPAGLALEASRRSRQELTRAYNDARSIGLPTTAAEFAAQIPPAKPSENAAALYRSLRGLKGKSDNPAKLNALLLSGPDVKAMAEAKLLIADRRRFLDAVDQAVARPRCFFDRDWKLAYAVIMAEYADMKLAGNYLSLHATIQAERGDFSGANAEVQKIFQISRHAREEPTQLAELIGLAIYMIGCRELASLSIRYPTESRFYRALESAVVRFPNPNVKRDWSGDLFCWLDVVDSASSAKGRAHLGIQENSVPFTDRFAPGSINPTPVKTQVVRAEIRLWKSIDLPLPQRIAEQRQANLELSAAMKAIPVGAYLYDSFAEKSDTLMFEHNFQARKQTFIAALRGLKNSPPSTSIETEDLLSPFDGKPLRYQVKGKRIEIEVSGLPDAVPGQPTLTIPPRPKG